MHIMRVDSNLKIRSSIAPEGQYVFIQGDNASGKSGIVHSLEYALTGLISDAAGRDIKTKQYVDTLACEPEAQVEVTVSQDGARSTHDGKKPHFCHVMHTALKAIGGTGNALIDYLLEYGENFDDIKADVILDYDSWDKWKEHYGERKGIQKVRKAAGTALRKARAEIKELGIALRYTDTPDIRAMLATAKKNEVGAKELKVKADRAVREWAEAIAPAVVGRAHVLVPLRFHFRPNEVRLGVLDGGPVPSGAEMVEAAIGLAYATRDPSTAVYVMPDKAYDPERLAKLLRVLRTVPCAAAIVQSPIAPDTTVYDFTNFWAHVRV